MVTKGQMLLLLGFVIALIRFFSFTNYQFTGEKLITETLMNISFVIHVILFFVGFIMICKEKERKKTSRGMATV
jgi:hypothetical protein